MSDSPDIQAAKLRVDAAKLEFQAAVADLERLQALTPPSSLDGQPQPMRRAEASESLQPRALGQ